MGVSNTNFVRYFRKSPPRSMMSSFRQGQIFPCIPTILRLSFEFPLDSEQEKSTSSSIKPQHGQIERRPLPRVSEVLLGYLASAGVSHVFLIPGDDPHLNAAVETHCQPVVLRDERAAAFAAQIYGRLTGLGACMSSHGPGMSNLVTGLAAASLERDPVIAICSQLPLSQCNNQSHAYISEDVLLPVTKELIRISEAEVILAATRSLLRTARTSPSGPVALSLPQDISASTLTSNFESANENRQGADIETVQRENPPTLAPASHRINQARHVLLIVGAGVIRARAAEAVRSLARKTGSSCATTLQAKGLFYPQREVTVTRHSLFNTLHHLHYDLCLIIGVDSTEGLIDLPDGEGVICFNESRDASRKGEQICGPLSESIDILERTSDFKSPQTFECPPFIEASHIVEICAAASSRFNGIVCVDTGLYKHAWATFGIAKGPNRQIFTNGLSSIGWSLAAAIGAHYASGERVLAVIGDGGFSMAASELFPIFQYDLPISVLVIQDDAYGMIRRLEFETLGRNSRSVLLKNCDYVELANAFEFEFLDVNSKNVNECFDWNGRRRMFHLRVDYSTYEFS
jgi:acetolactate synthase-1/2/3 large subunit